MALPINTMFQNTIPLSYPTPYTPMFPLSSGLSVTDSILPAVAASTISSLLGVNQNLPLYTINQGYPVYQGYPGYTVNQGYPVYPINQGFPVYQGYTGHHGGHNSTHRRQYHR